MIDLPFTMFGGEGLNGIFSLRRSTTSLSLNQNCLKNIFFFHVLGLITIRDQRNTATDKLKHTMTKVVSDSAGIRNTKLYLLLLNIKYHK